MDNKMFFYLADFEKNSVQLSDSDISKLQESAGFIFPADYLDVVRIYDGREGGVGENGWLVMFPFNELININSSFDFLMGEIPEYFIFGKDAADTLYAFHKQNSTIHSFGSMSGFDTDPIEFCGESFLEFLDYLYRS